MEKNGLRERIRAERLALSGNEVASSSGEITKNVLHIEQLRSAKMVAAYLPFANEVDTRQIIGWLWRLGKEVCVPVVSKTGMRFAKITAKTIMKTNSAGIPQPTSKKFVQPKAIGAFLVPGVAFSRDGHRIGTGKGFYDKFFNSHKLRAPKIGLAYGFQIVERIMSEGHDVAMDFVVTENGVIKSTK